jgi:hypothetical protein
MGGRRDACGVVPALFSWPRSRQAVHDRDAFSGFLLGKASARADGDDEAPSRARLGHLYRRPRRARRWLNQPLDPPSTSSRASAYLARPASEVQRAGEGSARGDSLPPSALGRLGGRRESRASVHDPDAVDCSQWTCPNRVDRGCIDEGHDLAPSTLACAGCSHTPTVEPTRRAGLVPYSGVEQGRIGIVGPRDAVQEMTEVRTVVFNQN